MMDSKPKYFSIKNLLSEDNYVIPIYQRDYAWQTNQIQQLVQDIADSYVENRKNNINKKYYIGTLITYAEKKEDGNIVYQVIDGQQRLTTLTLLLDYIKNKHLEIDMTWYSKQSLHFDCRQKSTSTLDALFNTGSSSNNDIELNVTIRDGYEDIQKCFPKICKDNKITAEEFCNYLFNNVIILRVLVPFDTDLNHYFEIMNSRGEQLEKHEILKANCLKKLKEEDRYTFALIWDACSNMERYVQYGFSTDQRDILFHTIESKQRNKDNEDLIWNYIPKDESEVYDLLKQKKWTNSAEEESIPLDKIIDMPPKTESLGNDDNDTESIRFNTIINFSNFLLHILKIQLNTENTFDDNSQNNSIKDIPLDDKRLIDSFNAVFSKLKDDKCTEFVKRFGYNLLKGKLLYDKYIIKREFVGGNDRWSLKKFRTYGKSQSYAPTFDDEDKNKEIIMLLSMFHVSTPTLVYKNWLNGVLLWLFKNPEPSFEKYKEYLENLAKAYFFDHYVACEENELDFYEIMYANEGIAKVSNMSQINLKILDNGINVENFIFNYLDYWLWQDFKSGNKKYFPDKFKDGYKDNNNKIINFEYTFRSSVEHYYPQHPIDNQKIDDDNLNCFGNLCLISSSKNSRLSNYMPIAKKEHYNNSPTIDSIKQCIMMSYDEWDTDGENNENEIQIHAEMMRRCLFDCLGYQHQEV